MNNATIKLTIVLLAGAYVFGVVLYLSESDSTLIVSAAIALAIILFHTPIFKALGV